MVGLIFLNMLEDLDEMDATVAETEYESVKWLWSFLPNVPNRHRLGLMA